MSKNVTKKSKDAIFLTSFISVNIFFELNNVTEALFRVIFNVNYFIIYFIFYITIIYFHCFIFLLLFKVILLILK